MSATMPAHRRLWRRLRRRLSRYRGLIPLALILLGLAAATAVVVIG